MSPHRYFLSLLLLVFLFLGSCAAPQPTVTATPSLTPFAPQPPTATLPPPASATPSLTPTPTSPIPAFRHIVIIIFENKEFGTVIGNRKMPFYNRLAQEYTLLTQYYAITHPSLPNYLALIGGDTFGITRNCESCFVNAPNLADFIEASGRRWKTYQEDLPRPCFVGSTLSYVQKHNPFIYFDSIRLNPERCQSIVPLSELKQDLEQGQLPDFAFITPNLCNSAHDCGLDVSDAWLENLLGMLLPALEAESKPYLVVLTWDEGQGSHSCCGLPPEAGGRVATVLISSQVRRNFQDDTPYTHYSLLKTILTAWQLPLFGHAAEENHVLIEAPFKP